MDRDKLSNLAKDPTPPDRGSLAHGSPPIAPPESLARSTTPPAADPAASLTGRWPEHEGPTRVQRDRSASQTAGYPPDVSNAAKQRARR